MDPLAYPVKSNERAEATQSLQSLLLFAVPVVLAIPLYAYGLLPGDAAYFTVYSVYILGSLAITRYNGRAPHEIGLSTRNLGESLLIGLALVAGRLVMRIGAGAQIRPGLTVSTIAGQALYNFVFSGLGQEILFRGLMLFSIWRWKGPKVALVVSSILFGVMHVRMGIGYVFRTAVIGAWYGYAVYKTRSIVGPILAHGLYNFLFDFLLVS